MHSSKMCTAHSSSRPGGLHQAPLPRADPPDQAPLQTRHPPLTRHPSRPGIPPGADPPTRHPPAARHAGIALPCERMTNRCKHITLPQTSFADGNKILIDTIIKLFADQPELSPLPAGCKLGNAKEAFVLVLASISA